MTWLSRQLRRTDEPVHRGRDVVYPHDDLLPATIDLTGLPADCCSARAAYRVLIPAGPGRETAGRLLFCGHHFRLHRDALRSQRAAVYDDRHRLVAS